MTDKRFDVFLSYAGADRDVVEVIARRLRERNLIPFLDRWHLPAGQSWPHLLETRLAEAGAVIVALGPHGLGSWQRREMYVALDRQSRSTDFPVIPVLLPGADDPALGFLKLNTWVDLRGGADDAELLDSLAAAVRGELPGEIRHRDPRADICPYRGLNAFREEDAPFFVGREQFAERLELAVRAHDLVAVVGPSGSGKSSAVAAGLVPRLRAAADSVVWDIVTLTPGKHPLRSLAATLSPPSPELSRAERVARVRADAQLLFDRQVSLGDLATEILAEQQGTDRLLLVVDQWEELYTQTENAQERDRFIGEILDARGSGLSVVLTARGDFFGQVLQSRRLSDALQDSVVHLSAMNSDELRRSVIEPASQVGLVLDDGLADRILADVGDEPGYLPLLEFLLTELWRRRERGRLTHKAYEAIGGVRAAIATRAEQEFAALDENQRRAARRLLIHLVNPGEGAEDTRARVVVPEGDPDVSDIVRRFADSSVRLLVTGVDPGAHVRTVEVSHESLIRHWGRLRHWIDENRELLRVIKRVRTANDQWQEEVQDRDSRLLPAGRPLEEARELLAQDDALISDLRPFIERSIEHHDAREAAARAKDRAQRRILAAVAAVATVFAIAASLAGIFAFRQIERLDLERSRAQIESRISLANVKRAQGRALDAESLLNSTIDAARRDLGEHDPAFVSALVNRAQLHADQREYPEAIADLEQGLGLLRGSHDQDRLLQARVMLELARARRDSGDTVSAIDAYGDAEIFIERHLSARHPLYALSKIEQGDLYRRSASTVADAVPFFEEAFDALHVGPTHPMRAEMAFELADASFLAGHLDRSMQYAGTAFETLSARHAEPTLTVADIGRELQRLLACREMRFDPSGALPARAVRVFELMQQAARLQEAESIAALRDIALADASLSAGERALRARALRDWRAADAARDPALITASLMTADEWSAETSRIESDLQKFGSVLDLVEGSGNSMLERLPPRMQRSFARAQTDLTEVLQSLRPGEAVFNVVATDQGTFVALLEQDSARLMALPVSSKQLSGQASPSLDLKTLSWLFDAFIRPIMADLDGVEHLIVSPSPPAQLVPWHALLELPAGVYAASTTGAATRSIRRPRLSLRGPFRESSITMNGGSTDLIQSLGEALMSGSIYNRQFALRVYASFSVPDEHNRLLSCRRGYALVRELIEQFKVYPSRLKIEVAGRAPAELPDPDLVEIEILDAAPVNGNTTGDTLGFDPDKMHFLFESLAVSVQPTLASVVQVRQETCAAPPPRNLLALAPVFGSPATASSGRGLRLAVPDQITEFGQLPFAQVEIHQLGRIVGGDTLLLRGNEATLAAINSIDLSAFRYLVFSTHGIGAGVLGGDEPGVILPSGEAGDPLSTAIFGASSILEKKLSSETVVLSASATMLDGEFPGLSRAVRALQLAGSKSVVATYWTPSDEGAMKYSTRMMTQLRSGTTTGVAEASRRAMLELLKESRSLADVMAWAAFGVVGEGTAACFAGH